MNKVVQKIQTDDDIVEDGVVDNDIKRMSRKGRHFLQKCSEYYKSSWFDIIERQGTKERH